MPYAIMLSLLTQTALFQYSSEAKRLLESWEALNRFTESLSGSISTTVKDNGQTLRHVTAKYKMLDTRRLVELGIESNGRKTAQVFGINPRYGFKLIRGTDERWVLGAVDSRDGFAGRVLQSGFESLVPNKPLTTVYGTELGSVIAHTQSQVKEWGDVQTDGMTLLRVVVECPNARMRAYSPAVERATLHLNPAQSFAIVKAELNCVYGGDVNVNILCINQMVNFKDLAIPKEKQEVVNILSDPKGTLESLHVYDVRPAARFSESEFTLDSYGLEEPYGSPYQRPIPWFLYAGMLGGAILVICVLLAWWQKRLQVRAA